MTIFGLFAVYSTSIWKSFDQGTKVTLIQNIETVKAFNTFLDNTIIQTTTHVIDQASTPLETPQNSLIISETTGAESSPQALTGNTDAAEIPQLDTLQAEFDEPIALVSNEKTTIKNRDNYKYFSNQIRSLIVSLIVAFVVYLFPTRLLRDKKIIWILLAAVTIFQLLVFVPGLEAKYGTAR